MATQNKNPASTTDKAATSTLPPMPPMQFTSIGDFKSVVRADVTRQLVIIEGVEIALPVYILNDLLALGIKRSFDTNAATEGFKAGSPTMPQFLSAHLNRLLKGYMSKRDEEKALSPVTGGIPKGKQYAAFGRFEIIGKMSDLATTKIQNEAIIKIQALDDSQWSEYVKVASLRPDSLLSLALQALTNDAAKKAKVELAKQEAAFNDMLI